MNQPVSIPREKAINKPVDDLINFLRTLAKTLISSPIWNRLGIMRRHWVSRNDDDLPTKEVFSKIYAQGLWGTAPGEIFYSGGGSRNYNIVKLYIDTAEQWAWKNDGHLLSALDLGCGSGVFLEE
jgi:hypothetical protein